VIADHTPGPWHVVAQEMGEETERQARICNPWAFQRHIATHIDLDDPDCRVVCDMRDGPEDDARIIAAAPEMLQVLRDVLDWYANTTEGDMPPELHDRLIRSLGGEVAP
jgi:hypothetical protein